MLVKSLDCTTKTSGGLRKATKAIKSDWALLNTTAPVETGGDAHKQAGVEGLIVQRSNEEQSSEKTFNLRS